MCHGSIDPKFLMREAEDRYHATAVAPTTAPSRELPPELMGGLSGVCARLRGLFPKPAQIHPAE